MNNITFANLSYQIPECTYNRDLSISTISIDTRTLKQGEVYLAIVGSNHDGHDFIQQAISKGASGIITSKKIDIKLPTLLVPDTLFCLGTIARIIREQHKAKVIGITGSCGKTTIRAMIQQILQLNAQLIASQANYNNEIGLPLTLMQLTEEHEFAVLEMGATKQGDINYLVNIARPDIGIVANAAACHLDTMGNLHGVATAKGEMFSNIDATAVAILNVDDDFAYYWRTLISTRKTITFGIRNSADIAATNIKYYSDYTKFLLKIKSSSFEVKLPLPGEHNVMNALAAISTAFTLDVPIEQIIEGLESFSPVNQRSEFKIGYNGVKIIDDSYNANPNSVRAAIKTLENHKGKKILVLADMLELGDVAKYEHKRMGEIIKNTDIDELYLTGDLTKFTADGFGNEAKYFTDKQQLISSLKSIVDHNSTVLIKGSRSMGMEQIVDSLVVD